MSTSNGLQTETLEMVLARTRAAKATREVFVVTQGNSYVASSDPPTWGPFETAQRHYTIEDARTARTRFLTALRTSKASTYILVRGNTIGIERHTIEVIEVEIAC